MDFRQSNEDSEGHSLKLKHKMKFEKDKRKYKWRGKDKLESIKEGAKNPEKQDNTFKFMSGCFICDGPHHAHDCPK